MATSVDTEVVEVYLDHAASTPLRPEAQAAWLDASARHHANPTGAHRAARAARRARVVTGRWIINLERRAPACGVRQCPRANCRQQTHTTRGATTPLLSWMARTHS